MQLLLLFGSLGIHRKLKKRGQRPAEGAAPSKLTLEQVAPAGYRLLSSFLDRRAPRPPIKPVSSKGKVAGSGVTTFIETPSRSEKGGSPLGVPMARNERTSLPLVAVKSRVEYCQPVKPWLGSVTMAVSMV